MGKMTDGAINHAHQPELIATIAERAGIPEEYVSLYGKYKAKIDVETIQESEQKGKLVLVTAMSPTVAGEGKTTVCIGLADALNQMDQDVLLALREPSMGPVFGMKGGATGGGYAQLALMEDINLHFTGDFHAITSANNLLAAAIDNHIYHGNALEIDPETITWNRAMDMNDRQLRVIESGLGGRFDGVPREEHFDITAASEVMAIFCLASNLNDLQKRLNKIVIGQNVAGEDVTAQELGVAGGMAALLKEAFQPNLAQTLEGTPALVHGGPFANIAHGCNSVVATNYVLGHHDICVTEAGFGSDLGAEKFLDIKCRVAGIWPDCVVMVATIRALKLHGGVDKNELEKENIDAMLEGMPNLEKHLENMQCIYQLPTVIALNFFPTDTEAEIQACRRHLEQKGYTVVVTRAWGQGGKGSLELAEVVLENLATEEKTVPSFAYELDQRIETKITELAQKVYGAKDVDFTKEALRQIATLTKNGHATLPICIAKTQYSLSDDAKALGASTGFTLHIREVKVSAGAAFIVAISGKMMTMPGLPKHPAFEAITLDDEGKITGIF